jgi:hypothetical protein
VNNELLMQMTADMPLKVIEIGGKPYLERYYAGPGINGAQVWLHHFLTADAERHLHTHPFSAKAVVLCGGYTEQIRMISGDPRSAPTDRIRYLKPGDVNQIYPNHLHRIAMVETDTWTMLFVDAGREPVWKFIGDEGSEEIRHSSPEDWHIGYKSRRALESEAQEDACRKRFPKMYLDAASVVT